MHHPMNILTTVFLVLLLQFAFPGLPARAGDGGELAQLQTMLEQQQVVIQQLLENQRQQGQEIQALRRQLQSQPAIVGSVGNDAVDESYEIEPEAASREQREALAAADQAVPPVNILPAGASFSVGGHINRAVNIADDGDSNDAYYVDSGSVPTLSYLKASLPVSEDLTLGAHLEVGLQHNSALAVSQDNQNTGFSTSSRYAEMTLDSRRYGKLWFGRGLMASFIVVDLDKSQTWRYNILSPGNTFAGLKFVNKGDDSLSDIRVGTVFLDAEAFNRKDRVRYDSPVFAGFRLSGSTGTADAGDLALRWNGDLAGLQVTAAASWQNNPIEGRVRDRVDGGVALFHPGTGLSLTVAGATQDYKRAFYQQYGRTDGDNSGYGLKLGLRRNWFGPGETRIALDYFSSDDVLYKDDDARSSGLFISQSIDAWSLEPYVGYRLYDYDVGPNGSDGNLHDVSVWVLGARMALDLTIEGK